MLSVRFLGLDVFGTVVDWRTSIARELNAFLRRHESDLDPEALADAWRGLYQPSMERVRSGELDVVERGTTVMQMFINEGTVQSASEYVYHHPDDADALRSPPG